MTSTTRHCYDYPHPAVTTDVITFRVRADQLQVLLVRRANPPFQGRWALPGGFLDIDEDLEQCARRELAEETGIRVTHIEQLHTFGRPDRDPRERVISVAYLATVRQDDPAQPVAASDAAAVRWFPLDELPGLAFDHGQIIDKARQRLRDKLEYTSLVFQLTAETFTLGELQRLYEAIHGSPLDKRNFRKRMLGLGQIEETGHTRRNGKHRPAREYRIRHPQRVEYF